MKHRLLPPIKPSAKIDAAYRTALFTLIEQMNKSVERYCLAAIKPVMKELAVQDAAPMSHLQKVKKENAHFQNKIATIVRTSS